MYAIRSYYVIATADTGKFEISISEMDVEFAPGIGKMKLKYELGDSAKVLLERYSDEDFLTKMFVFDKDGRKLHEIEENASIKGEFIWDGYFGNGNKDSLLYSNGPFKLSLALTNARITSYNVCYTKLLRPCQPSVPPQ